MLSLMLPLLSIGSPFQPSNSVVKSTVASLVAVKASNGGKGMLAIPERTAPLVKALTPNRHMFSRSKRTDAAEEAEEGRRDRAKHSWRRTEAGLDDLDVDDARAISMRRIGLGRDVASMGDKAAKDDRDGRRPPLNSR